MGGRLAADGSRAGLTRLAAMRVLLFGTYDTGTHPRVGVLREGLRRRGADVRECNAPLGVDTAARVATLARPWRAPLLLLRVARR